MAHHRTSPHPQQHQLLREEDDHNEMKRSSFPAAATTHPIYRTNPQKLWYVWRWVRVVFTITVILQLFILWMTTTRQQQQKYDASANDVGVDQIRNSWNRRIKSSTSSSSSLSLYQLALDQSYGFFNDIPESDWKRHQERARTAKSHRFMKDPLRFWYSPGWWYLNNYEPVFTCPHVRRVGGVGDGPKWTCDPHRIPRMVQEERIRRNDPDYKCLIYSVGSAGKYEWEDGLLDIIGTNVCEVHVFDPGDYEHNRTNSKVKLDATHHDSIFFHKWGWKSSYNKDYKPFVKYGTFHSLPETLELLGHVNRTLEILKIDCEQCEWFSVNDWLTTPGLDVRQILVETHNLPHPQPSGNSERWPYPPMKATDYFDAFIKHNYYLFSKEVNSHPKAQGNGVEWAYIKLHPDFGRPDGEEEEEVTLAVK